MKLNANDEIWQTAQPALIKALALKVNLPAQIVT
jgi:hypothetical protein